VRISAQLIAVETGHHIWSDHYDRDFEDPFSVQDEVTQNIVAVLPGRSAVRSSTNRLVLLPLHLLVRRLCIAPRKRFKLFQICEAVLIDLGRNHDVTPLFDQGTDLGPQVH